MAIAAPVIKPLEKIHLPNPEMLQLRNGIPLYAYNGAHQDIIKIDILFDAGRWTEPAPLVADAVAKLIKSGTSNMDSATLSENIDFYGSTIKAEAGYNSFTITLICLNIYLRASLELLLTCLRDITFPEEEVQLCKTKSLMRLKVNLEKNDYLADMALKKGLFGACHPYGYETKAEDIKAFEPHILLDYYRSCLSTDNATILVSGKYNDQEMGYIAEALGRNDWGKGELKAYPDFIPAPEENTKINLEVEGSVQSSIALGMHLFNRQHEDYPGVVLMNMLYGGYFGSRLMQNIREEKGLTYGIYSEMQTYKHAGLLLITTETDIKNTPLCLQEIHAEAKKLRNELVLENELSTAKNYIMGKMLARTDGPFTRASTFRSLLMEGKNPAYFDHMAEEILATDRYRVKQLAERYLHPEKMHQVVVS